MSSQPLLALNGGSAVAAGLREPSWPPRNEETAKKLLDLYWRGNWSFSLDGQESALCTEFAAAHDAAYAVFMANGTISLQCALAAYGIGPGDEVIVPAFTCMTSVQPIKNVGAKMVTVDVEASTLCLNPQMVAEAINQHTRAIMPVHLYGSLADMDSIIDIARRHDLVVIEDCAHVHGARWASCGIGSLGHVGSFSFHQKKPMACGEGGICITNDARIAESLHRMIHIGYAAGEYGTGAKTRPAPGLPCSNLSATEFQALIVRDQLANLPTQIACYNRNVDRLRSRLSAVPGLRVQSPGRLANPQTFNKLLVLFDEPPLSDIPIEVLLRAIRSEGLPVKQTYGAVYQSSQFNFLDEEFAVPGGECPVTETIGAARGIVLDHHWLGMSDRETETVAEVFTKVALSLDQLHSAVGDQ